MSRGIFLSHSSSDKLFARKLAADLQKHGFRIWIDEAELSIGDSLVERIADAINDVDYVGIVLSPESVKSEWVRKELAIAISMEIHGKGIKVIPMLYKTCDIPGILRDKVYADFTTPEHYNSSLKYLIQSLSVQEKEKSNIQNQNCNAANYNIDNKRFEFKDEDTIITGFSTVYRVKDNQTGMQRLLKQMRKDLAPEQALNFDNLNIKSRNIAIPLKQWEDDNNYYELLEYIEGWTLEEVVKLNCGNVLGELLTSWTKELLNLLLPLHRHDPPLIHRDFRPSNIMVKSENLRLILIDCSSIVLFDQNKRYTPLGSPGYIAPEIIEGSPYPSSDIYSLGSTLFRMNTGQYPPTLTQNKHFHKSMKLVHAEYEVENIFDRLIAFDYHERFDNAQVALNNIKPPDWSLRYKKLRDFHLPDGRAIRQGGLF